MLYTDLQLECLSLSVELLVHHSHLALTAHSLHTDPTYCRTDVDTFHSSISVASIQCGVDAAISSLFCFARPGLHTLDTCRRRRRRSARRLTLMLMNV